jgi:hypothetical protein
MITMEQVEEHWWLHSCVIATLNRFLSVQSILDEEKCQNVQVYSTIEDYFKS